MLKKQLHVFALLLLLIGQTILGPLTTVSAEEYVEPISEEVGTTADGQETVGDVVEESTATENEETTNSGAEVEKPEATEIPESNPKDETGGSAGDVLNPENLGQKENSDVPNDDNKPGNDDSSELVNKALQAATKAVELAETSKSQEDIEQAINLIEALEDSNEKKALQARIAALAEMSTTADGPFDPVMPESVIVGVNLTMDGKKVDLSQPVEVKNGDKAAFEFEFGLPAGHDGGNYGEGTKLTYVLPEIFGNVNIEKYGDQLGNGMGTVAVVGRTVTITFNEELNGYKAMGGSFWVEADFSSSNTEWTKDIELIENEVIKLNFQPKGGDEITKTGTPDTPDKKNSKFIDWTVTVNTDDGNTGVHSFVDELTGPHTFVSGSIEVKEIPITPSGPGTVATNPITVTSNIVDNKLTIDLPNKAHTGYQITYKTEVGDAGNVSKEWFRNQATYNGTPKSDDQEITFGDPLAKRQSGPGTDQVTTWTIDYNFNNRNISQTDATLTDTWEVIGGSGATPKQDLIPNSFVIYEEDGTTVVDASQYTMTPKASGDGFDLSFKQDVTKPYVIQYQTKPDGVYPTTDFTVTNVVKRADMTETKTATANYTKKNLLLNKSTNGIDYGEKEMSWKIVANQSEYDLPVGTVFEDTYGDTNMALNGREPVVNLPKSSYDFAPTMVDGKETGFTITLKEVVSSEITITYTTDYEIKDSGQDDRDRTYKNTVTIQNSNLPANPTDSAEHIIKDEQKNNGKKEGYYDYATKTFHWDVELNFNYNELDNAVFEDELPVTQKVESIVVQEGTLNAAGQFVPDSTKIIVNTSGADHKIKLELGNITKPHKVTYTSKDADGVFPHGNGTVKIENIAKLSSDAGANASWDKEVEVKHTDKIFNKSGSQKGLSAIINWNFEFNYAQSELKQVVIKDTIGKDGTDAVQMILPDSFKVYKVAVTGQTPNNPNTSAHTLVDASEYTLDVDVKNGTFTLNLGDVDTAYYVTYDTMFTGDKNAPITNEVEVAYVSPDGTSGADQAAVSNFNYGNTAWTRSVPFVIIKTDAATGEVMEDVEFTLYGPYTGDTPLFKGKTDENGVLDFGVEFAEALGANQYTLKETKVTGYENPDVKFNLDFDGDKIITVGAYDGYQLVSVENVKEKAGPVCNEFTLTIKDVDGNLVANKEVTLTNTTTGQTQKVTTDANGQIKSDSDAATKTIDAGTYTVTTEEDGKVVTLGKVTVTYYGDCEADIQPDIAPTCTEFTITVNGTDDKPREAGVNITLKSASGDIENNITDENGKFTVPTTTPAGTYTVYEGKQFLGTVEITYKNDPCAAEVQLAPKCETFTLTVRDVDGNVRDNETITVTIKVKGDANDPGITKITSIGILTLDDLEPNVYEVYEGTEKLGEFSTNTNCEGFVQPAPTCEHFTITVRDEGGKPRPRVEVNVTVINKDGNSEKITATTNDDGEITIPNTTKPGNYKVFEGELLIGDVDVSYKGDCKDEVKGAPTCTDFTLTVNNKNGLPREEGVKVTIKNSLDQPVIGLAGPEFTTNANGEIEIGNSLIKAGTYTVYDENGGKIGDFTVKDECSATVQPASTTGGGGGGGGGGWNPPAPACKDFTVTAKDQNGNPRANVVLTLKNTAGTVYTLTTNVNGEISLPFATTTSGQYTVYEGNTVLGSITVYYSDGDCQAEVTSPIVCTDFTITVKDSEGKVRGNVSVTVKDQDGKVVASGTTNAKGEITVPNTVPSGKYTVYEGDKTLGTVTIDFAKGNCKDEVTSPKVCTDFTITVKDSEGEIRANVSVTVKDTAGKVVASGTTNAKGEITVPNTVPTGKYTVYEGEKSLGTVTIDFAKGNCKDEVTSPKVCTDFTLTVKDADGNVRGNVSVTVKDAAGKVVASGTTNAQGEMTVPKTVPTGSYTVFEGDTALGTITIDLAAGKCDAVVTIPGEPEEPGEPDGPEEPEEPGTPEQPGEPGTPGEPDNPDDGGVLGGQGGQGGAGGSNGPDSGDVLGGQGNQAGSGTDKPKLPQTGDAYPIGSMLAGFGIILAGFWLLIGRRAKKNAM